MSDELDDDAERQSPPRPKRGRYVKSEPGKIEIHTVGPKELAALIAQRKRLQRQRESDS